MVDKTWSTSGGDFSAPSNWTPTGIPTSNDAVTFLTSQSGSYSVSGSGSAATLTVNDAITMTGSIGVSGNGTIVSAPPVGSGPGHVANLAVTATGSLTLGGILVVGPNGGGLEINGALRDGGATIGPPMADIGSSSLASVSGPGASWTSSGSVTLGFDSILLIANGGAFSSGGLVTGFESGVSVDSASNLVGPVTLGGTLKAIASTSPQPGTTVTLSGPVAVVSQPGVALASDPGTALNIAGAITDAAGQGTSQGPLVVEGTVILSNAGNTYAGGTAVMSAVRVDPTTGSDNTVNTLVLDAAGAAGRGPIYLAAPRAALAVHQGASAASDGSTVVIGGAGADTVSVSDSSVFAYGGSGSLTFYNGSAASTVVGSTGSLTAFAGTGGGLVFGSQNGNNVLLAGTGAATLVGGGSGDQLYANAAGGDVVIAGSGNETLTGGQSGTNVLFGGTGADVIKAGAGADVIVGGSGDLNVHGGASGGTVIFAGSGSTQAALSGGSNYVQMGSGSMTVSSGSGASEFAVYNGLAGNSNTILGFKNGVDHIALRGYQSPASIASSEGNTVVTFSDKTSIILSGVSLVPQNLFN